MQVDWPILTVYGIAWSGTPGEIRTPNPQIRSLMLCPLSYGRICVNEGLPEDCRGPMFTIC